MIKVLIKEPVRNKNERFLIAIFLVSLIPVNATSQLPNPDIQWTADWEMTKMYDYGIG